MDIIMNTSFQNSLLPMAPKPGFSDNFDRPVAPLGVTSGGGRPWQYFSNGVAPVWRTSSGGTAVMVSGAPLSAAVVDGLASDGRYQVTCASLGSTRRGGPALRFRDIDNHLFLWQPSATEGVALYKRINGTATRVADTPYIPSDGDSYNIVLNGPNVIVGIAGVQRMAATITELMGETRHGLIGTTTSLQMGWDTLIFTPGAGA